MEKLKCPKCKNHRGTSEPLDLDRELDRLLSEPIDPDEILEDSNRVIETRLQNAGAELEKLLSELPGRLDWELAAMVKAKETKRVDDQEKRTISGGAALVAVVFGARSARIPHVAQREV